MRLHGISSCQLLLRFVFVVDLVLISQLEEVHGQAFVQATRMGSSCITPRPSLVATRSRTGRCRYHGDLNETFLVGPVDQVDEKSKALVKVSRVVRAHGLCRTGPRACR